MSSNNEASSSGSTSERDDGSAGSSELEDPMQLFMSLLAQSLPSSATSISQEEGSDKNSPFDDSQLDDTLPGTSAPEEHDETGGAPEIREEQANSTNFSQIINALIERQLTTEKQADNQQLPEPRRDLFKEHTREEALILDNLAGGPQATAAERQKVADETAEIRQQLAGRSMESVAESVARHRLEGPMRAAAAARRARARYELELASMRRQVARALEEEETPDGVAPDRSDASERMRLMHLRGLLHGQIFQTLQEEVGSFDGAVKTLFDRAWKQKIVVVRAWNAEKKLMRQMREEGSKMTEEGGGTRQAGEAGVP